MIAGEEIPSTEAFYLWLFFTVELAPTKMVLLLLLQTNVNYFDRSIASSDWNYRDNIQNSLVLLTI